MANEKAYKDSIYTNPQDVDFMPVYKDCGGFYTNRGRFVCMRNNIFSNIFKNLNYPKESLLKGEKGSVVVHYMVKKDGAVIPTGMIYSSEQFKKSTLFAIKEWLKEIKDFKASPAFINKKPVKFSDFLIFTFNLDEGSLITIKTQKEYNSETDKKYIKKIIPLKK